MLKKPTLIEIAGPAGRLETLMVPAIGGGHPRGVAVIAHPNPLQGGTHTNKVVQTTARALAHVGYACYCPNLRGVGNSEGQHGYGVAEVDDAAAVLAYAQAQHGEHLPVVLAGFSFGSFVMAQLSLRVEAKRLILLGPAVGRYAMPTVREDTLVIHGEEDEVIALAEVLDWARPQMLPIVVFPGTGHFFHGKLIALQHCVIRALGG